MPVEGVRTSSPSSSTTTREDVLRTFATAITHAAWFSTGKGGQGVVVLGPEHAGFCIEAGLDAGRGARVPLPREPDRRRRARWPPACRSRTAAQHDMIPGEDGKLASIRSPDDILLVTAGGEGAGWSA